MSLTKLDPLQWIQLGCEIYLTKKNEKKQQELIDEGIMISQIDQLNCPSEFNNTLSNNTSDGQGLANPKYRF